MARDEGGSEFWLGLILGGIIGAGLALLFAPQAGRQTREQLTVTGTEVSERARTTAEEVATRARETAADVAARGRAIIEDSKAAVGDAFAEGRQEAARVAQDLQAQFQEERRKATR